MFDLDGQYGKTYREHSRQTEAKTSGRSSRPSRKSQNPVFLFLDMRGGGDGTSRDASWEEAGALPGESLTRSIGEFPRDAKESTLSQILQENVPEKYYLSARACQGILNRAERRGKKLPEMLEEALKEAVRLDV